MQAFHHAPSIARLDDDNFAVLVSHAMLERIHQPMQQLIEAVAIRNKVLQRGYPLSFSMGLTKFNTSQHEDIDQLIAAARAAMLVNKQTKAV